MCLLKYLLLKINFFPWSEFAHHPVSLSHLCSLSLTPAHAIVAKFQSTPAVFGPTLRKIR